MLPSARRRRLRRRASIEPCRTSPAAKIPGMLVFKQMTDPRRASGSAGGVARSRTSRPVQIKTPAPSPNQCLRQPLRLGLGADEDEKHVGGKRLLLARFVKQLRVDSRWPEPVTLTHSQVYLDLNVLFLLQLVDQNIATCLPRASPRAP